jgi:hypothetical protein
MTDNNDRLEWGRLQKELDLLFQEHAAFVRKGQARTPDDTRAAAQRNRRSATFRPSLRRGGQVVRG